MQTPEPDLEDDYFWITPVPMERDLKQEKEWSSFMGSRTIEVVLNPRNNYDGERKIILQGSTARDLGSVPDPVRNPKYKK